MNPASFVFPSDGVLNGTSGMGLRDGRQGLRFCEFEAVALCE